MILWPNVKKNDPNCNFKDHSSLISHQFSEIETDSLRQSPAKALERAKAIGV